jgi:NAD+ kinase
MLPSSERRCDLVIVVGGDGTLAARGTRAGGAADDVPLLGINLGRLGFLVDISPDHLEAHLDQILAGEYATDAAPCSTCTATASTGAQSTTWSCTNGTACA